MRALRGFVVSRPIGQISTLAAGQAADGFSTTVADIIEVPGNQTKLRFFDLEKRAFFGGRRPRSQNVTGRTRYFNGRECAGTPSGRLLRQGCENIQQRLSLLRLAEFCPVPSVSVTGLESWAGNRTKLHRRLIVGGGPTWPASAALGRAGYCICGLMSSEMLNPTIAMPANVMLARLLRGQGLQR